MTVTELVGFDACKAEGRHVKTDVQNPRLQNLCGRCGRLMDPDEMPRDVSLERSWTEQAATFAQYVADPDAAAAALTLMREKRMGDGPWLNVSERDWIVEALEEVADLSAYVMAALTALDAQERDDEDAGRDRMLLFMALSAAVTAFDSLRAVEQE
jgi:hypothetical protein